MTRYKYILPQRITLIKDSIFTCNDVIPKKTCSELINIGQSILKPARTVGKKVELRTNKLSWICPSKHPALEELQKYCSEISGKDIKYQETPQFLKYSPGEFYGPHEDFLSETFLKYTNIGSLSKMQRGFTFLFYLNEGKEGGETRFPKLSTVVKPKTGKLLMWKNVVNGKLNTKSTHEGLPPKDWTKYALTIWTRTP